MTPDLSIANPHDYHYTKCDRCGEKTEPFATKFMLVKHMKKLGWEWINANCHVCPKCVVTGDKK